MGFVLTPTQSQILVAFRTVLLTALPSGIEIVLGQQSRLPEPPGTNFVVLTPILRFRLETNTDFYQDVLFTGSIIGSRLTVSNINFGIIRTAASPILFGVGIAPNTIITSQVSGAPGGIGDYNISVAQTITTQAMAAGVVGIEQPTRITIQCDVHGPNSPDNVQIIATLMRSLYASELFRSLGVDADLLYAGEPKETPFFNAEQQVEWQWTVDACIQANQTVNVPQQFAGELDIETPAPADVTKPF